MKELARRVAAGEKVHLDKIDPRDSASIDRAVGEARLLKLNAELTHLQELLYAAASHSVLVVLQGLDTAGKDGTISHVMSNVNPQGCQVVAFKTPTALEQAHDFLWRVHQAAPARGVLTIFNRSHYEDVLVVRVHNIVPPAVWEQRYVQIVHFEDLLASTNTIILKFYLHISKDEQQERLLAREKDQDKAWKLSPTDWVERRSWDAYIGAYEDALSRCSTEAAPWYVVPADRKWFRNLAIAQTLVDTLRAYEGQWREALEQRGRVALQEVKAARATDAAPPRPPTVGDVGQTTGGKA